jgi:hypothetical protein
MACIACLYVTVAVFTSKEDSWRFRKDFKRRLPECRSQTLPIEPPSWPIVGLTLYCISYGLFTLLLRTSGSAIPVLFSWQRTVSTLTACRLNRVKGAEMCWRFDTVPTDRFNPILDAHYCLLGCNAIKSARNTLETLRNILVPTSRSKIFFYFYSCANRNRNFHQKYLNTNRSYAIAFPNASFFTTTTKRVKIGYIYGG